MENYIRSMFVYMGRYSCSFARVGCWINVDKRKHLLYQGDIHGGL